MVFGIIVCSIRTLYYTSGLLSRRNSACGDFGLPWGRLPHQDGRVLQGQPISYKDGKKLKQMAKLKATFLFVDGNHENFDLLERF